jgi:hemerythrin-like domain-containing protein
MTNNIVSIIYQAHKNIKENLVILNDALAFVKTEGFWKAQNDIATFFNDHLTVHFRNEEIIFDIAKKYNKIKPEDHEAIEQIVKEHKTLLSRYEQLKSLMADDTLSEGVKKEKFIVTFRDIIKVVLKHAEKEDAVLFPMLERYMDDKQLKEADEAIKRHNL